ncbi:hypothetical protein [Pseudoduganella namucuonensis]|uniref:Uncharacterized protein n=1 Tax=Pseudoduganella namucuonensis TaxID=1035707 RepID=A0A1I7F0A6_9BURK|nr:hypothetical protein [Pseudoduganella namucuonensis]SFU29587.1 hypothetical protein SAMN05216552_1001286 [Pseudoduganella namucuonensis]
MHTYDFFSNTIELNQVKLIIQTAGYHDNAFVYDRLAGNGGYRADGDTAMYLLNLQRAATKLKIKVRISSPNGALSVRDDGTPYSLSFTMSEATVNAMQGYSLVAFKGVKSPGTPPGGAVPVTWFSTTDFITTNTLNWTEDYEAYASLQAFVPKGQIDSSNSQPITIGESMQVADSGIGTVVSSGQPNAISVQNMSNRSFTCGISQAPDIGGAAQPICAFNLMGGMLDIIIPEEKVFLMFASGTVDTGVVLERSLSRGILVDLTGVESRAGISYDSNNGWSWGGFSWGQQFPANYALAPLLVDTSQSEVRALPGRRLALAA